MTVRVLRRGELGSALVSALILCAAIAATAALMSAAVRSSAEEQRLRADALCALHAARSGLLIGPLSGDGAGMLGGSVTSLRVELVARGAGWCVLRSRATCGEAARAFERTVDEERCR
jgi:hypothetical protein